MKIVEFYRSISQWLYYGFWLSAFCGFFEVQYIDYCWKHYVERLRRNLYIFFLEVINWKENKQVGTICFEIRIPIKKPKIFMEFVYLSLQKWLFIFEFNNFILEKKIYLWKHFYTMKKPLKHRANINVCLSLRR